MCDYHAGKPVWEVRANPRGPGGGRLISPSALPLPGILFCLFLCLSLGPDPGNEITEVRAEIFSVQDTSGLWPFPWLQEAAERLCLSFPACLVWMAHTLGGPLLAVLEMKQALLSFFFRGK